MSGSVADTTADDGVGRLVGAVTHVSDDERYRPLNRMVCPLAGIVGPRRGPGFEVALDVAELVWEAPSAWSAAERYSVPRRAEGVAQSVVSSEGFKTMGHASELPWM